MEHLPHARTVTPVAIVGAGPVGLAMAIALARQGVRSTLLERNASTSAWSRAPAIHVRTREIFRQWGIETRFVRAGVLRRQVTIHAAPNSAADTHGAWDGSESRASATLARIDFGDLHDEADRPGLLILEQGQTERLLLDAVRESGMCDVRFDTEVTALDQRDDSATLTLRDSLGASQLSADFIVGCDGARSFVRRALGLPFDGMTYALRPMLADVRIADARDALPWPRIRNARDGLTAALRLDAGLWRLIRLEERSSSGSDDAAVADVPHAEVAQRVADVLGEGPFETVWASRFRIHRRASPRFRVGRILLAGDAAHVHSPVGGQGMNGGIADAHNLGWKLAQALRGGDTDRLLDSYDIERRAVIVGDVSRNTDLVTRLFLQAPALLRRGAFGAMRLLLHNRALRRRTVRRVAMLDLDYGESPLLDPRRRSAGVRLPNVLLRSAAGRDVRLYALLPNAPVLIALGDVDGIDRSPLVADVIRIGRGRWQDLSGLLKRLVGGPDGWMLVRPDAHIAWAATPADGLDAHALESAVHKALGARPVATRT